MKNSSVHGFAVLLLLSLPFYFGEGFAFFACELLDDFFDTDFYVIIIKTLHRHGGNKLKMTPIYVIGLQLIRIYNALFLSLIMVSDMLI